MCTTLSQTMPIDVNWHSSVKRETFVHFFGDTISCFMTQNLIVIQSSLTSVRLKLKISVTTEPIGIYSSGIIPAGPVVVLAIFFGWGHPQLSQK